MIQEPDYEYLPEDIFQADWNYSADEICQLAGIPRDVVDRAAKACEISSVCVMCRGGTAKAWKGHKVAVWIRSRRLPIDASPFVRRTVRRNPAFQLKGERRGEKGKEPSSSSSSS